MLLIFSSGGSVADCGGIVARNDGEITNTKNLSPVKGGSLTGGIATLNYGNITKCINEGIVESNGSYAGGIVCNNYGKVSNCTNLGKLDSNSVVGGIIADNYSEEEISGCDNGRNDVEQVMCDSGKTYYVAGIVGSQTQGQSHISNCNNYMNLISNSLASGIVIEWNSHGSTVYSLEISNCNNYGNITADMMGAGIIENYNGATSDKGIVNISGCTNRGEITGGSSEYAGGIADYLRGYYSVTISNCKNLNTITTNYYDTAGIVGRIDCTTLKIENCQNSGEVNGGIQTGGIIGYLDASGAQIISCTNEGNVNKDADKECVGGILGDHVSYNGNIRIFDCKNTGYIHGSYFVGGICGRLQSNVNVSSCINSGNVVGGGNYQNDVGGIIGYTSKGEINTCLNSGDITGPKRVGGITGVGYNQLQVYNCGNSGKITGLGVSSDSPAGLVGYLMDSSSLIKNCYNTGEVVGTESGLASGITKLNGGSLINVYNAGTIINGASIAYINSSSSYVIGAYSLENCASAGMFTSYNETTAEQYSATELKENNMKAQSFVDTLNKNRGDTNEWILDTSNSNKGYPIFKESND
jgi:hypothetical protein